MKIDMIRTIFETFTIVLIVILFYDNMNFHTIIKNSIVDLTYTISHQKRDIEFLQKNFRKLDTNQQVQINSQKSETNKISQIKKQIEEIDSKIEGLVCILKIDQTGTILECSGPIKSLLGFDIKEVVGSDIAIFMDNELRQEHIEILQQSFEFGLVCDKPVTVLGKNKNKVIASLSVISAGKNYIVTLKRT